MAKDKEALVLFSGGRDSFLAACYVLEAGYRVHLVTFENGLGIRSENAKDGAERIIAKYSCKRVSFHGVHSIAGIWRQFFLPYFNLKPKEISECFGELTISQFHCLTCRSAMYIWSIIKARQLGISVIVDGARKDQGFVIELPSMIDKFKSFFKFFLIELMLPVWDMNSDWERKNLLLLRGFFPKTMEPQCLLGVPIPTSGDPDHELQQATINYFDDIIFPRAKSLIHEQGDALLDTVRFT